MTHQNTSSTRPIDLVNGITIVSSGDACAADGSGCGCSGGAANAESADSLAGSGCGCGGHEHGTAHAHAHEGTVANGATATFAVAGMTCAHCVASVSEEVGAIAGVTGVDVRLVKDGLSQLSVTSDGPIDPRAVGAAVTEAGYRLA